MLAEAEKKSHAFFKKLYEWEEYFFLQDIAAHDGNVENPKELFKFFFDTELEKNQNLPEEIKSKITNLPNHFSALHFHLQPFLYICGDVLHFLLCYRA